MEKIVPVILSGGSGTRLRPLTGDSRPKQFLRINEPYSLLQDTLRRALDITGSPARSVVTVTLEKYADETKRHLGAINRRAATHVLSEPAARNTAAAVIFATLYIKQKFGEKTVTWILPSDHSIKNEKPLRQTYKAALPFARQGQIVTFGIPPTRPETGYGYIQRGQALSSQSFNIQSFTEKPDEATARRYLESGLHYWNSGMFLARADIIITEFARYAPEILRAVKNAALDSSAYEHVQVQSFDRAIMEKTSRAVVIPCDPEWSDIGSWESLMQATGANKETLLKKFHG